MKKVLGAVSVFVASVVGAGFATGKEIVVFFSRSNPCLVFVLLFATFSLLFWAILHLSILTNCFDVRCLLGKLLKNFDFCYDVFALLICLVMTSSMIAGSNEILCMCFNFSTPFFGVATAFLVALLFFAKSQKAVNFLCRCTTLLIVIFVAILFVSSKKNAPQFDCIFNTIFSVGSYAGFNVICSLGALCNQAKTMSKKQAVATSLISAFILSATCSLMIVILNPNSKLLPTLELVRHQPAYWFGVATVSLSILSTLWANAIPLVERVESKVKNKPFAIFLVFGTGWLLSNVGFDNIVKVFYPIVSLVCLATSIYLIFQLFSVLGKIKASNKVFLRVQPNKKGSSN